MSFRNTLFNLRTSRGLTQKELSDALDHRIAQGTLAQYEIGARTPSLENLYILADFYGVPVSRLFVDDEPSDEELVYSMIDMMHRDENYRVLFDATRKLSPEDIKPIVSIMQNIAKGRNKDE